ncbi:FlgD immunoglobulin-like domain containing protein [Treponema sp.]|uniref:FlgD immunoglobulin-like domain containing protein n=1 Tax=Treponema sp. TaxID=166 RepID=UPI0025D603EB|nr:FlgD immunoglobulin-like domain containing protein [Treponema sp.]MCR5219359.1 OmpA family protein [Treponema sp.]
MKNVSKKVKLVAGAALVLLGTAAFAERSPQYISPNNDGRQDRLEVPLKIRDKRYISAWSFVIRDAHGNIVRTIGNKVQNEGSMTFTGFFKKLVSPKQSVEIPEKIIWNGFCDDGSLAKDGVYKYKFYATDDSGNNGESDEYVVIVDNTPPVINLAQLTSDEKNFGEGAKSILRIKQSGSEEELWTAKITDQSGKTIRSYKWEKSEPLNVEWNGTDDKSAIVPDGLYNYEVTATDLAGNVSEKALITNILFSAEKPETAVAISGSKYFSPEGQNSKIKNVKLDVTIPNPTSSVNSLTEWSVQIVDAKDKVVREYSGDGKNAPKGNLTFDGKDSEGKALPEGQYRAKIAATYLNGYKPEVIYSPEFVIDNSAPKASATVNSKIFNGKDRLKIALSSVQKPAYTGAKTWTGTIVDAKSGAIVKQYNFGSELPAEVEWDSVSDAGTIAADGDYSFKLDVADLAGNTASVSTSSFKLDTSKTEAYISISPAAFSPNGNGVQEEVKITPKVNAANGLKNYTIRVVDSKNKTVWEQSGNGNPPESIMWNGTSNTGSAAGTKCEDGEYKVTLDAEAQSGTKAATVTSSKITLDTKAPLVKVTPAYTSFSPEATSTRQTLPVKVEESSTEALWKAEVIDSKSKKVVRTYTWTKSPVKNFAWDGTDSNGNKVDNGTYSIALSSTDAAGNSAKAVIDNIKLDARQATVYVTNELTGFSPNGDGILDKQKFTIHTSLSEGISKWSFDIVDANGKAVRSWTEADSKNLPANIDWAGDTSDKTIANGVFSGKLHVEYEKGNVVDAVSSTFICTAEAPKLSVGTSPKWFSPDNDGTDDDLQIKLKGESLAAFKSWSFVIRDRNGNMFWKTSGKSAITPRIIWDGRGSNGELVQSAEDYPYEFTVTDELGMTSKVEGKIQVDVLVVRDGDKLKMQVPSIIFRSDNADFNVQKLDANGKVISAGITADQAKNNERVINRIAEILKKFSDYKVVVVGHANPSTNDPAEETTDNPSKWGPALGPLSLKRAEFVKNQLIKLGVSKSRLGAEGKGGTEPVADTKDKSVNWKNRRVEFILEK